VSILIKGGQIITAEDDVVGDVLNASAHSPAE
jgi:hypothetical protein